jgi:DNA-binding HxlR family transcriptional regulator
MSRTSSIATMRRGWEVGRALMAQPQRFSDLMLIISHTAALSRVLKKLTRDGLARKRGGDGWYQLTLAGQIWIQAALPLLQWTEQNPRNATPRPLRGNDPVLPDNKLDHLIQFPNTAQA